MLFYLAMPFFILTERTVIFSLFLYSEEYIYNKTECIMIFVDHQTITLDDVSLIIQKRRKYLTHEFLCQS